MATKKRKPAEGDAAQAVADVPLAKHPWENYTIKTVLRSKLKNAPYNPRKISDKARARLQKGMEALKLLGPLNWNERTGNIVGGHQRVSILDANANGAKDYYLTVAALDLSESEEVEANLLLNNAEAQGDWDLEKLADMLKVDGLNLDATGFGADDIYRTFGDDIFTESTAPQLEEMANKLRTEREKHAKIVEDNQTRDNSEFYLVIVFRNDIECGNFILKYGLANNTYHSAEAFEKLMLPPKNQEAAPAEGPEADEAP